MKSLNAYFDGTAVRVLDDYKFKLNQKFFINIPETEAEMRKQIQLDALSALTGLLDEKESDSLETSLKKRVNFSEKACNF